MALWPGDPPPASLALVAAVALDEVAAAYAGSDRLAIKWPNDLLLDGAKLSGILLERSGDAVVIGFGVNLAKAPTDTPYPATSLAAAGVEPPDPGLFCEALADSVARWVARWRHGLGDVRAQWCRRAHPVGTPLVARLADGAALEGLFDGLDGDGGLRLRNRDGVRTIHAGDVFPL